MGVPDMPVVFCELPCFFFRTCTAVYARPDRRSRSSRGSLPRFRLCIIIIITIIIIRCIIE